MQWAQKLLSTRSGTFVLAGVAAILAAIIFLLYLNRYRESVNESSTAATVLVAKNLIPKGTSGDAIGAQGLFQVVDTTKGQLLDGALVDPAALRGQVTVADIFPGHQLTIADFTTTTVSSSGGIGGGGSRGSNVTLKVTPEQAADLAFAADHGKIWLILRPRTGAAGEAPELVTAETMLLGVPAVAALNSFGGRR